MSTVAYIQADMVMNPFLLKEINKKPIIEHTIERLLQIAGINSIAMCLHKNSSNLALGYLENKYPILTLNFSKEQNAGKRMIEMFRLKRPCSIIRVTGDQIFLDIAETQSMIDEFKVNQCDISYHDLNDGLLPEILSYHGLEKCQIPIGKYHRLLKYINDNPHNLSIKKREHGSQTPFFRFFIRNDREFHVASQILQYNLDYNRFNVYGELLFGDTGLYDDGWFESFESKQSTKTSGELVPWMTYPAIDFLTPRVKKEFSVFEYGCGAGTIWWSKRVGKVTACEHTSHWATHVRGVAPENVTIIHVDLSKGDNYARQVEITNENYHVIVIDSRDRINCAKSAVKSLTGDGVIIWDDSQRERDDEGKEFILSQGFRKLEFKGMGPIVKDKNETTIFYRDGNCLGI